MQIDKTKVKDCRDEILDLMLQLHEVFSFFDTRITQPYDKLMFSKTLQPDLTAKEAVILTGIGVVSQTLTCLSHQLLKLFKEAVDYRDDELLTFVSKSRKTLNGIKRAIKKFPDTGNEDRLFYPITLEA